MKLIEISNISVYRKGGKSHFFYLTSLIYFLVGCVLQFFMQFFIRTTVILRNQCQYNSIGFFGVIGNQIFYIPHTLSLCTYVCARNMCSRLKLQRIKNQMSNYESPIEDDRFQIQRSTEDRVKRRRENSHFFSPMNREYSLDNHSSDFFYTQ